MLDADSIHLGARKIFIRGMASHWHFGTTNTSALFLLLALTITTGVCFQCWDCNSWYDWRCDDPFTETSFAKMNCSMRFPNATGFVCRKLTQTVKGKTRTVRSCGYVDETKRPCYRRSGTYDVHVEYCQCSQDSCNTATPPNNPINFLFNILFTLIGRHLIT